MTVPEYGLPPLIRNARSRESFACNVCLNDEVGPCNDCASRLVDTSVGARAERRKMVEWLDDKQRAFYESGRKNENRDEIARGAEFLRIRLAIQRGEHDQ